MNVHKGLKPGKQKMTNFVAVSKVIAFAHKLFNSPFIPQRKGQIVAAAPDPVCVKRLQRLPHFSHYL
jgi:hypothetical protein